MIQPITNLTKIRFFSSTTITSPAWLYPFGMIPMVQKADFSISFGYGLGRFKKPLLPGGRKFEKSKGYKIVNTMVIISGC